MYVVVHLVCSKPSFHLLKPSYLYYATPHFCTRRRRLNPVQVILGVSSQSRRYMEPLNEEQQQLTSHIKQISNADEQTNGNGTSENRCAGEPQNGGETHNSTAKTVATVKLNGQVQDSGAKPLSKSAQKKLQKMERNKALKMQRKAFEKEKRHEEAEKKRKEWEEKLASASPEEQERLQKEKLEKRQARMGKAIDRKSKLRQAMESGQNLVIDLEFCDRMKQNELLSLVQQVMYSYAANAKTSVPVRFSLTGCTGDILSHLEKVSGFSNWLMHKQEKSYLEVFQERKDDLVYLTADSDTVIEELDDTKIYIIGGLVDRNRWKGLTLEKAVNQGIATAKLPIAEHLKMSGSMVLTVNQVVEIFLRFLELKDWDVAFREVIPQRKRTGEDVHDEAEDRQTKVPQLNPDKEDSDE